LPVSSVSGRCPSTKPRYIGLLCSGRNELLAYNGNDGTYHH
jgi:hypothetical protein